jgi:hypothetical protein
MTTPQDELLVLDTEPGSFAFYAWQNVTICVWISVTSQAHVARLVQVTRPIRERYPAGGSSVHIVRGAVKLPDSATRASLSGLQQLDGDWLAGVAVVLDGNGFWASTMRSVITAMRVVSTRAFELRMSGSIEEVVEWLPAVHLKRSSVALDPAQLLEILRKANHDAA